MPIMRTIKATLPPPNLKPALLPSVHFGLTVTYSLLYSFLFLFVYVQLWMILYYRHKRISFQTVFLFSCLFWAGLRVILFSFYFNDATVANALPTFLYWILYCLPVCLQFFTLTLLVVFFFEVSNCKTLV